MSVYALRDPRTGACRYVGHTRNPKTRLQSHLTGSHSPAIRAWVAELRLAGCSPEMEILGPGTEAEWMERLKPDMNVEPGDDFAQEDVAGNRLDVRVTSDEKDLYDRAAKAEGMTLSVWVRWVCRAAAKRVVPEKKGRRA